MIGKTKEPTPWLDVNSTWTYKDIGLRLFVMTWISLRRILIPHSWSTQQYFIWKVFPIFLFGCIMFMLLFSHGNESWFKVIYYGWLIWELFNMIYLMLCLLMHIDLELWFSSSRGFIWGVFACLSPYALWVYSLMLSIWDVIGIIPLVLIHTSWSRLDVDNTILFRFLRRRSYLSQLRI